MKNKTFFCEHCKEECISAWSEEEAVKEAKENFGENILEAPHVSLCDDCYKIFIKALNG